MSRRDIDFRSSLLAVTGLALVAAYLVLAGIAMAQSSYNLAGALLVAPGLATLSVPLLARARRNEDDPWVRQLIPLGLLATCLAGLLHLFVTYGLYGGAGDARRYDREGAALAAQFWNGDFVPHLDVPLIGTGFIILLTGIVYAIIGPTLVGGFMLYSWIAFWGLYLSYRAFRVALPGADHRRYAVLMFFLPSMLLWSSGIGKEPWMILSIGLTLLGAARLLTETRGALLPLLAGLTGTALVRPHVTAMLFVALSAAVLFRRSPNPTLLTPLARTLSIALLIVGGVVVALQAGSFLKVDELTPDTASQALDKTRENTSDIGASTFVTHPVQSPLDLPQAMVTVLFRPFPWEATNLLILFSAAEGVLLLALTVLSWNRWRRVPGLLRKRPYLLLSVVFMLLFVIAFSTIGNFGLLVRQRIMLMPLALVPLCLATRRPAVTHHLRSPTLERAPAE